MSGLDDLVVMTPAAHFSNLTMRSIVMILKPSLWHNGPHLGSVFVMRSWATVSASTSEHFRSDLMPSIVIVLRYDWA